MLFDVEKGHLVNKIEDDLKDLGMIGCCAFSRDGKRLLVGGYRGPIVVWEVDATGGMRHLLEFKRHQREVNCIAISRDGTRVLSGDSGNKLIYWEAETGQLLYEFSDFTRNVEQCYFTPNGKQAVASDGKSLRLYDLQELKFLQSMNVGYGAQGLAIAPDGRHLAIFQGYDVRIYNTITGEGKSVSVGNVQWSATFSPDGQHVLTGGHGKVYRWDAQSGEHIGTLEVDKASYIKLLACSPDGKHIAASGGSAGQDVVVLRLPAH